MKGHDDYGYDFEDNESLQKFQRADGSKQCISEHLEIPSTDCWNQMERASLPF